MNRSVSLQLPRGKTPEHYGGGNDCQNGLTAVPAAASGHVSGIQAGSKRTKRRCLQDKEGNILQRVTVSCDHQQVLSSVSNKQGPIADQSGRDIHSRWGHVVSSVRIPGKDRWYISGFRGRPDQGGFRWTMWAVFCAAACTIFLETVLTNRSHL